MKKASSFIILHRANDMKYGQILKSCPVGTLFIKKKKI